MLWVYDRGIYGKPFSVDRLYTSESDVYRHQILTYNDGPCSERVIQPIKFIKWRCPYRPLVYKRVYLPLYKGADTPFHIGYKGTIYSSRIGEKNTVLWAEFDHFVSFDMKGCICHFTKWQIHPFISTGTIYSSRIGVKKRSVSWIWPFRPLWYERVYLTLNKVADTPFYIQRDDFNPATDLCLMVSFRPLNPFVTMYCTMCGWRSGPTLTYAPLLLPTS